MEKKVRIPFVVDENPYCLWDIEVQTKNLQILNRIDPDYFAYLADVNINILNDSKIDIKTKQYAAICLRTSYSHGLEALFSLIGATIQAPDCVLGWLLKYQNSDLLKVVKKIHTNQPLQTNIQNSPLSWKLVSEFIFSPVLIDADEKLKLNVQEFSNIWHLFAEDFINQNFIDEYNSIKHGLRSELSGFSIAIDNIRSGNEFGSSYFQQERLDKSNFIIHELSRNWHPENFFHSLHLITASMKNIITFLKGCNGDFSPNLRYSLLQDLEYFNKPWEKSIGLTEMKSFSTIPTEKIPLLTKEEIKARYDTKFSIFNINLRKLKK